jgi:hypothetical protein
MTINELINFTKLSKRQFALYYKIPYKTFLIWTVNPSSSNYRTCPLYFLKLLERVVKEDFS